MSTRDPSAVESLLQHADWVRRLARELANDESVADDLIQETWLAAMRRPPRDENLRGWLSTVLRRKAGGERSRSTRRRLREEETATSVVLDGDPVERLERQREILSLLLELPEAYRRPLVLRFFENLKPADIATRLNLPVETVRTRIKRGLERLRSAFGKDRSAEARHSALLLAAGLGVHAGPASPLTMNSGAALMTASSKISIALVALVIAIVGIVGWRFMRGETTNQELETARVDSALSTARRSASSSSDESASETAKTVSGAANPQSAPVLGIPTTASPPAEIAIRALRGRVILENGSGVAGATIFLASASENGGSNLRDLHSLTTAHSHGSLEMTDSPRSDAKGSFLIAVPPDIEVLNLAAFHPSFGYGLRTGLGVQEAVRSEQAIRLEPGVVHYGKVVASGGAALADVEIDLSGSIDGVSFRHVARAITDENGNYRTHSLPFLKFTLSVDETGYEDSFTRVQEPLPGQREVRQDFELERARVLSGKLLEPDGRLFRITDHARRLAGDDAVTWLQGNQARVFADFRDPGDDPNFLALGHCSGQVDLEHSSYHIALDSKSLDWVSVWIGPKLVARTRFDAEVVALDLVVNPNELAPPKQLASLELVVEDRASGHAIQAFELELQTGLYSQDRPLGHGHKRSVNGKEGRARLDGLQPGIATLLIRADGHATHYETMTLRDDGSTLDLVVRLDVATGSISGRVIDDASAPIGLAQVRFLDLMGRLTSDPQRGYVTTDENGRFQLLDLAPVAGILSITADGHAPLLIAADAAAGSDEVLARLERGVEVSIAPTGADGPFSFRILDLQDIPLTDDGYRFSQRWGSGFKFRVPAATLVLETRCPGFTPSRLEFQAHEGLELKPHLEKEE
ncbi:MAG: sigma-70 family RNA polymerase sigma factor [Planctomycetes bacterium]|nr:sigma-70 family RNA polymerase sigma factor [Planctomycetota bacterium]